MGDPMTLVLSPIQATHLRSRESKISEMSFELLISAVCFAQVISVVGVRRGGTNLIHLFVALFLSSAPFLLPERLKIDL